MDKETLGNRRFSVGKVCNFAKGIESKVSKNKNITKLSKESAKLEKQLSFDENDPDVQDFIKSLRDQHEKFLTSQGLICTTDEQDKLFTNMYNDGSSNEIITEENKQSIETSEASKTKQFLLWAAKKL